MSTKVKICGLKTEADVAAAADAGATYVGLMFFEKSPRHLTIAEAARLAPLVPEPVIKVAVTVNAEDPYLDQIVGAGAADLLQLHGKETPDRVAEIKARYGLPVMKVISVADTADLDQIASYAPVVDQLLIESKPPKDAVLPGGNGLTFDWRLVAGFDWPLPWMLAGGLHPGNVAEAIRLTGAPEVDVSSGVEAAPGVKDPDKIAAFIRNAQSV
ncbi:MAG: phosphoribosylanthranilate isomerase [Pseudomonadota bacterium]